MKLSQRHGYKIYCSEPIDKIEHYEEALAEDFAGWCIHHRLEIQPDGTSMSRQELKDKDLYFNRPASELVFMRCEEHTSLHHKGKHKPEEHRKKIAEACKGRTLSEETRRKLSESLKGRTLSEEHRKKLSESQIGKHRPDETRKKISESLKGRTFSEETCKKMSESLSGEKNPMYGKHRSAETRHKLSQSLKGKTWWNNGVSNKKARECPGEGWQKGILKHRS